MRCVALLRGINVGGRNKVAMADLRAVFEAEGYGGVATYIQSGNVLFDTGTPDAAGEDDLEAMLANRLGMPVAVVVRTHDQLRAVVDRAPDGFGADPDTFHCDVVFLRSSLTADEAMAVVQLREGVDRAWPGVGVLYFQRLSARRSQSKLSKLVGTPAYQHMTIRNWRTTTRLLALLDDPGP